MLAFDPTTLTTEHADRLRQHAETALPLAYGSLVHTFAYALSTLSPHLPAVAKACEEQSEMLEQILKAGLISCVADDQATARAYLDAHIEAISRQHPLLARYAALHAMRLDWLPKRQ